MDGQDGSCSPLGPLYIIYKIRQLLTKLSQNMNSVKHSIYKLCTNIN